MKTKNNDLLSFLYWDSKKQKALHQKEPNPTNTCLILGQTQWKIQKPKSKISIAFLSTKQNKISKIHRSLKDHQQYN